MASYIALIHKDADSDYGVSFPDLPGCVTAGATLDEARQLAGEALALHLSGLTEDGEPVPEPATFGAVMADPAHQGAVAILVDAPSPAAGTVLVNIALAEEDLREIDAHAASSGLTRSGFIAMAARRAIAAA